MLTPEAQILVRFALQLAVSDIYNMYKVSKNQKCTEWPQTELSHLTVKSTLYTLNTYPYGPNFRPFRSTTSRFWDTRSSKIANAPSDPNLNLTTYQSILHHVHDPISPEVQILVRFALRLALY